MTESVVTLLREHGIQPSAQRVAMAEYVLRTDEHPSADQVWTRAKRNVCRSASPPRASALRSLSPMVSRATVYNTLNLFVKMGLLREFVLAEGRLVYDPNVDRHHHFIDESTGAIHDIPWDALRVSRVETLKGFGVRDYQVVMRGRKLPASVRPPATRAKG